MSRILNALRESPEVESHNPFSSMDDVLIEPIIRPLEGLDSMSSVHPSIAPESRIEVLTHPNDFAAEQFRVLGARLQHLAETRSIKTLLVTSASFREGKSLVSLNLAITLAQRAGKKILLVEGDLRKPALCPLLGLPALPGLSDWVQSDKPLANFLQRVGDLNLWLLPAGELRDRPLTTIQSPRLRELPAQAAKHFDWIVIDSSPLLVADSGILSRLVDGTLVVVRQESTQKKSIQKSLASLEGVLGFVLNDATGITPREYDQYYVSAKRNGNGNGPSPKVPPQPKHPAHSNRVETVAS